MKVVRFAVFLLVQLVTLTVSSVHLSFAMESLAYMSMDSERGHRPRSNAMVRPRSSCPGRRRPLTTLSDEKASCRESSSKKGRPKGSTQCRGIKLMSSHNPTQVRFNLEGWEPNDYKQTDFKMFPKVQSDGKMWFFAKLSPAQKPSGWNFLKEVLQRRRQLQNDFTSPAGHPFPFTSKRERSPDRPSRPGSSRSEGLCVLDSRDDGARERHVETVLAFTIPSGEQSLYQEGAVLKLYTREEGDRLCEVKVNMSESRME